MPVPLSVLDLSPVPAGSTVADALRDTLDLARSAERAGYARFWLAEHHFNPGVAGASPAVLMGAVAAATTTIRVGSGAVQTGHRTPLSVVEDFGTLDGLHPGRIDLGLGRSGGPRPPAREPDVRGDRVVDGVLVPAPVSLTALATSPRFRATTVALRQPGAQAPPYEEFLDAVEGLIAGTWTPGGVEVRAVPGEGAGLQTWVLGSSGGESAVLAGRRGLPFAANYHVSPATVLDAVAAYREAFRPSDRLDRPHVMVSADVVVGTDDAHAARIAAGFAPWVHSIRTGVGAIPYPRPEDAEALPADPALVTDRVATRLVGGPATVADALERLRAVTGADELLLTTITHRHTDRVVSQELLAREWATRT